jgi:hypothetical protein
LRKTHLISRIIFFVQKLPIKKVNILNRRAILTHSSLFLLTLFPVKSVFSASDGRRGRTSTATIRLSVTIGQSGIVEIAHLDPQANDTSLQLGERLCDGQEIVTLCHSYLDNPMLTVFSNSPDGRCVLANSQDTVELRLSALTKSRDIPLIPDQPLALGTGGAELCAECDGKPGTKVMIQPSRPCNPAPDDPYSGVLTFRVESA